VTATRPKVLVMVDAVSDRAGGAERFAVGIAAGLPADRWDVSLCATRGISGVLERELDEAGVRTLALERSGRLDVTPFRRLRRFLAEERFDVLHTHKFGSNVWGTLIGRSCRVPVIVAHEHTWSYEGNPLRKFLDGQVIGRLATSFVAVSSADRDRMISIEGVPADKVRVVPTAYIPRPDGGGGDLRGELGIPSGAQVIGTAARLRPQKALTVLIDAFARIAADREDRHLVIVGDGECLEELRRAAAASGAGDRIHFPGLRTDIDAVLATFDVAAMSSDFEGLPLFVFECMAHSTPLVATDVGGLRDVVDDGVTGLLVPSRDPAALAAALERVVADPALGERIASVAAQRLGDFTMQRAVERFAALYDELLAQTRAA
jgi:glycosyltransferase involved in cell wall biosynthesis